MRAVVHRQLRAHPPCPTQRPQPPPHSTTHTAPPTAPHTAPAPAPTHHKAHSHADSNCESNAPLRPSSRRPTRRRRTRRHDCAPASAPAWPPAPPCWCALRPGSSWQGTRPAPRNATIRATFGTIGGNHGNALSSCTFAKTTGCTRFKQHGRTARCTSDSARHPKLDQLTLDVRTEKVSHGGSTCAGRAPCGSSCHPESGTAPAP